MTYVPRQLRYQHEPQRTSGTAVAALVMAILAWTVCPLLFAAIAEWLAHSARREIEASHGALGGRTIANAASVLAWLQVILLLGLVMAVIAVAIAGA